MERGVRMLRRLTRQSASPFGLILVLFVVGIATRADDANSAEPTDAHSAALKSAERIDELVAAQLAKEGLKPNPPTTDEQFVRRIYLDATGTIPTSKQAEAFFKVRGDGKRTVLIDSLLVSPGYAGQMYNWLADILRLVDEAALYNNTRPYCDWVKECLRQNRPWDALVREMLTAEGTVVGNPAAGYMLRDLGMPLDNLDNTVRIFLATRIGCAQCHDHPFDHWTQKEFYQLAAFFGGVDYVVPEEQQTPLKLSDVEGAMFPDSGNIALAMFHSSFRGVTDNTDETLRFPKTFRDETLRDQPVTPAVLFGKTPQIATNADRRKVFAEWVTAADNPRFALTIANRLWRKAFGIGLIEPPDDIRDDTVASNPELMQFLSEEMIRLKFDLREFQRIIYYTKTYQARAVYDDVEPGKAYYFTGPLLRRMTAEQVWDSLLTLAVDAPDARLRPNDDAVLAAFVITPTMSATDIAVKANEVRRLLEAEETERKKRLYNGHEMLRASELPQPAPEGHFLHQFGQSDRTAIADSHTDGTVPQLLSMFNGPVTHMMLEPGSVVYRDVLSVKSPTEQLERIFLCVLARKPTPTERQVALREIGTAGAAGYGNVIWSLLNTREFLFIQ